MKQNERFLSVKHLQDGNTKRRLEMIGRFYDAHPKATQEEVITYIPETQYMVELYARSHKNDV